MEIKTGTFKAENLRAIGAALPPDEPPLRVGDWCYLTSGSPSLLVVECDAVNVVVAWELEVEDLEKRRGKHWQQIKNEHTFPRPCLRRTVAGKWNVSPNIKSGLHRSPFSLGMTVVDIQQRRGTTSPLGAWRLFWAGKFGRPAIGAWDASGFYRDGKLCGRCLRPDGRLIYRPLTPDEEAEYLKSAAW